MLVGAIFILAFASIVLISSQLIPLLLNRVYQLQDKKVEETEKKLDTLFIWVNKEKLLLLYTLTPLILGLAGFLLSQNLLFVFIGVILGLGLPNLIIHRLEAARRERFQSQLADALMMLTSSLKGGLSLLQAFEVLMEEMPSPMNQEIGWVLRKVKMGVTLEESLKNLDKRMNMEELELIINSILVAKETGGDITKVFSRLSTTIRDNKKLKENIKTLTLQGRLQGLIMSFLPFIFIGGVVSFNPQHFTIMLQNELGRMLLFLAVIMQVAGMILIRKFSKVVI